MEVPEHCIFRVPRRMREVKPEAYRPQIVVIGPLHRSLDATTNNGNPILFVNEKYDMMEELKKTYFTSYIKRVGEDTIEEMRKTIQVEERNIRASYAESTDMIPSQYFVDLILHDAVFIMEFILRDVGVVAYLDDKIVNHHFDVSMVWDDLILLENQLPYFIFNSLFSSSIMRLTRHEVDELILRYFGLIIEGKTKFKHFTDMFRCVYEESLGKNANIGDWQPIKELRNADILSQAGVDFKSSDQRFKHLEMLFGDMMQRCMGRKKRKRIDQRKLSLHVEFEKGVLTMPKFRATEKYDMILRNVIAFEQCHVSLKLKPCTSNYIHFLNFLITSEKDVELLTDKEVVSNPLGRSSLVLDMVNKLQVGVNPGPRSQYYYVAEDLITHYKSRRKRCWATLRKVYFSDVWTGTATLAAVFLLLLTLIGTVASVIQAYKSF